MTKTIQTDVDHNQEQIISLKEVIDSLNESFLSVSAAIEEQSTIINSLSSSSTAASELGEKLQNITQSFDQIVLQLHENNKQSSLVSHELLNISEELNEHSLRFVS